MKHFYSILFFTLTFLSNFTFAMDTPATNQKPSLATTSAVKALSFGSLELFKLALEMGADKRSDQHIH